MARPRLKEYVRFEPRDSSDPTLPIVELWFDENDVLVAIDVKSSKGEIIASPSKATVYFGTHRILQIESDVIDNILNNLQLIINNHEYEVHTPSI